MGVRSWIRDIIILYVSWKIIEAYFSGRSIDNITAFCVVILAGITLWFVLEKIGIIPKG